MSNVETDPQELLCSGATNGAPGGVEVLTPRIVPLGGPRAMSVRRTLPQRNRSLIGAWCFLDHYGPDDVRTTAGMAVPPHPHTGLQTISWLFAGEINHADSAGNHATVRPGQLNLMTAGRGISHSEYSAPGTTILHGVQLWVALPDSARFTEPAFEHYSPVPVHRPGAAVSVFLGTVAGQQSPVVTFTPLVGAEISLDAGASLTLEVDAGFEHGVLVDAGNPSVDGTPVEPGELAYLGTGRSSVELRAGDAPVRLLFIGGAPLKESILMWWNFVGRSHEEIVAFRAAWQGAIGREPEPVPDGVTSFSLPDGQSDAPLPAPRLPSVELRPRANPPG
ncbi:pirin family protein [Arthrobacter sp. LAPM80]|uniref:pirin family protein n=1 Tax=Arthrobacter sp. LAPM80 TaxID=3141788 RepID=UPI00398B688F